MRIGFTLVLVTVIYLLLLIFDVTIFYRHHLNYILTILLVTLAVIWLMKAKNRNNLKFIWSFKETDETRFFQKIFSGLIFTYIISFFVIAIAVFEASKLIVSKTDTYNEVINEIKVDSKVNNKIGRVNDVYITNGFRISPTIIKYNVLLTGDNGDLELTVKATKTDNKWIIQNLEIPESSNSL